MSTLLLLTVGTGYSVNVGGPEQAEAALEVAAVDDEPPLREEEVPGAELMDDELPDCIWQKLGSMVQVAEHPSPLRTLPSSQSSPKSSSWLPQVPAHWKQVPCIVCWQARCCVMLQKSFAPNAHSKPLHGETEESDEEDEEGEEGGEEEEEHSNVH